MATRRGSLPVLSLRRPAIPKSRLPPTPHRRFLQSPSLLDASVSPSRPTTSAGAAVAASPTAAGPTSGYPRELLPLQLGGWLASSWSVLRVVTTLLSVWVHWISTPGGPDDMVLMLVGANVVVYVLFRLASLRCKMNHFTTSLDNFKSGRLHTLLTSAFSHKDVSHLFDNMIGLYFFGSSIVGMFGPVFLLKVYLTGALTGSAFFLAEMAVLAPRKQGFGGWKTPMLGASAAVNATILLETFLYPKKLLYVYFVIPIPAALVGAGLICADLWRVKEGQTRVSGSAHLGGAFVAALVWANLKGWI